MAYTPGFNPDALPAHAEPEQAAQILSYQNRPHSNSNATPAPLNISHTSSYQNKPPPQPPRPHAQSSPQVSSYQGRSPHNSFSGYGASPPPPQNYGFGPPPQNHGRPPHQNRPPPTPAPPAAGTGPGGSDPSLLPLFRAVDKDGSGQLTEQKLRNALVNGDFTSFDPHTVRMMIRMFDSNRSGTIGYNEFCGLWGFLAAWRTLFDRFDEDGSGNISYDEYSKALIAFGYRLSPPFVGLMFRTYDKRGDNSMSFDLFVQSCISLKRMTDVFKKYDNDRDGYITLSFEEFLTGM
ncbi:hypothetical protein MMC20_006006 [Loxospora ochrophaea]|nr:hypothetical protein [Loxospora ochrophaea]